jgi:GAF domain-containing protein
VADPSDVLSDSLAALSGMLLGEESLESVLQRVVELACAVVPGCDGASVTLLRNGDATTGAASDESIAHVDKVQHTAGEGPCLEAARHGRTVRIGDIGADGRYPVLAEAAEATGFRSALAVPLVVRGDTIGALNFYGRPPHAYDGTSEDVGARFAQQAAVAVANAQVHDRLVTLVAQLNEALTSRGVIEQAKGILMARDSCDPDAAFDLLRRRSQRENRKLRDIADDVVREVVAAAEAARRGAVDA